MINFKQSGDFSKTLQFLGKTQKALNLMDLNKFGQEGVAALASATPIDSSRTANSWYYEIKKGNGTVTITWFNSNVQNGVPIAVIIQYGHGTRNGGYVQGRDYINPALKPVFDRIAESAWKEVTRV